MAWYDFIPTVQKQARDMASTISKGYDWLTESRMRQDKEREAQERARAELMQEQARCESRARLRGSQRQQTARDKQARLDAIQQASESIKPTLEPGEIMTSKMIQAEIASGGTARRVEAEQAAEEDVTKERADAVKYLIGQGFIYPEGDQRENEKLIQEQIYRKKAEVALLNEQYEEAQRLNKIADFIFEKGFMPTETEGVEPMEPTEPTEKGKPERFVRGVGRGLQATGEVVSEITFKPWSVMVNMIDLLVRKDESEWTPEEAEFMAEMQKNAEAATAYSKLETPSGIQVPQVMMHTIPPVPDSLWESYEKLPLARQLVGELTYPGWYLLPAGATGTQARIGLKGLSARLMATGKPVDKLLAGFVQGSRIAVLPLEGLERLIALPFKAIGKGISKITAKNIASQLKKAPAQVQDDVGNALRKVVNNQPVGADDVAKVSQFSDDLGRAFDEAAERYAPSFKVNPIAREAGITPELAKVTARKPDGGKAFELYNKLFAVDPMDTTVNRLSSTQQGKAFVAAISKVPGGKGAVKLVDPTLSVRETMQAQKAQEIIAAALDTSTRRSSGMKGVVNDLLRATTPDGNIVKLFKVNEKGITGLTPKKGYEKASPAIIDVLEHPYKWNLSPEAEKFVAVWTNVRKSAVAELKKRGIKVHELAYEEGAGYFPRMVTGARGETLKFPKVSIKKPRTFATQLEAIDSNVSYTRDPAQNIMSFIDHIHYLIGADDLKKGITLLGRTPKDAVPITIKIGREQAERNIKNVTNLLRSLRRAKRGEQLPEATLRTIDKNFPEFAVSIRNMLRLTGSERLNIARSIIKRAVTKSQSIKLDTWSKRKAYKKALEIAKSPRLGEFESGTRHPVFRGRIFPQEVAKVLEDFTPTGSAKLLKTTSDIAGALRTTVASTDFSPMFIQGTATLGRRPDLWAKSTLKAFEELFKPGKIHQYMTKPENIAIRLKHPEIARGTTEFYEGMSTLGKIPLIGKKIVKFEEPFERFFTAWGDIARVEMAKALEPAFIKAGAPQKLGMYINRMTGVMDTRALGVKAGQRSFESGWLLFAPRYTRASMAYIGQIFQTGIVGQETRRSLAQLAAGGMASYVATAKAMGQEPHLDPSYPTFMTVKIGNRNVGIGGFYYSLLRFLADVDASVREVGGAERTDFLETNHDNPFIKFMRSRTSILTSLFIEGINRTDFLGNPLETVEDWAHWLFVEHMMPIALQEQIPRPGEEPPSDRLPLLGIEMAGLRTFPVEPFYEAADKYAQQVFQKDWNELWIPSKAGRMVQSNQQKLLLKRFPDLNEMYEKLRKTKSKKWLAEHGLEGDIDITMDAYAQSRYKKNFDDLTDTQKAIVKRDYEVAQAKK